MQAKIKRFSLILLIILELIFPRTVLAANCDSIASVWKNFANPQANISGKSAGATGILEPWHLECIFESFIGKVIALFGSAAVLMLVYGGFKYITSQGDQKATAEARTTLTYAVIGLIFLILSYFIIDIIANFTGLTGAPSSSNPDLRRFYIPGTNH